MISTSDGFVNRGSLQPSFVVTTVFVPQRHLWAENQIGSSALILQATDDRTQSRIPPVIRVIWSAWSWDIDVFKFNIFSEVEHIISGLICQVLKENWVFMPNLSLSSFSWRRVWLKAAPILLFSLPNSERQGPVRPGKAYGFPLPPVTWGEGRYMSNSRV